MAPVQARAIATRRRIIETAVELFEESGYGDTGLSDILHRAGVTKGAFYYHFDSKESVAAAIIEGYVQRNTEAILERIDPASPMLERVITASFTSSAMVEMDISSNVGNQLLQSLGQVSDLAYSIYASWTEQFVGNLTTAITELGRLDDARACEAAESMWASVLGCHLLSTALVDDDPYTRLSRAWRPLIQVAVPEDQQRGYLDLIERIAKEWRSTTHPPSRIRRQGLAASNS